MTKRHKRKTSDKEVLKHYTAYDGVPPTPGSAPGAEKMLDELSASRPTFVKAVLTVDRVLTGRKSAVIKTAPSPSKRKGQERDDAKDE